MIHRRSSDSLSNQPSDPPTRNTIDSIRPKATYTAFLIHVLCSCDF